MIRPVERFHGCYTLLIQLQGQGHSQVVTMHAVTHLFKDPFTLLSEVCSPSVSILQIQIKRLSKRTDQCSPKEKLSNLQAFK